MATRAEILAECEKLALVARETDTAEDFNAWREAEERLVQLDQDR